jgi:hypothetical protein
MRVDLRDHGSPDSSTCALGFAGITSLNVVSLCVNRSIHGKKWPILQVLSGSVDEQEWGPVSI